MKLKHLLILAFLLFTLSACSSVSIVQDLQSTAVAGTLEAYQEATGTASGIQTAIAATVAAQIGGPGGPDVKGAETPVPGAGEPTPAAAPAPQGLILGDSGFGQEGDELGLGFFVRNPNPGLVITESSYTMTIYDPAGEILVEGDFLLPLLLPGQETAIARHVRLPENTTAAGITIELVTGQAAPSQAMDPLTGSGAVIRQGSASRIVLGEINNPFPYFLDDLDVTALLFDAEGRIVGGGKSYSNFVRGMASNGTEVEVIGDERAVRAALYPQIDALPAPPAEADRPADAQLPEVVSVDFIQVDDTYGQYGVVLRNPNPGYAIPRVIFQAIVYAEDGGVLAVQPTSIDVLGPGTMTGFGSRVNWEEAAKISRVEIRMSEDLVFEPSDPLPPITAENLQWSGDDSLGYILTGDLVNPHSIDLESIRVNILMYDQAGDMLYANWLNVARIPAGSTIGFEHKVWQRDLPEPARIEVYALPPNFDDLKK